MVLNINVINSRYELNFEVPVFLARYSTKGQTGENVNSDIHLNIFLPVFVCTQCSFVSIL